MAAARKSKHDRLARDVKALELRAAGLQYDAIASQLGYANKSHAWKAIDALLRGRAAEHGDRVLDLELLRLDLVQRGSMAGALRGDARAAGTVLRAMDHRAKLTGLYLVTAETDDAAIKGALAGFLAAAQAQVGPEPAPHDTAHDAA